ncbi:YbhN family protein [Blastococcus sp. TF02A-30]|uniref:lysylphosphatidylglycerol synthase transmembrane domain-containing protein n=1 Tax=Blastococcus sp. TF02A-30 TaxID=2250580 RepID=UPI0013140D20|nr:YbhN family protein [Blastococcus sp. TF02A-30]
MTALASGPRARARVRRVVGHPVVRIGLTVGVVLLVFAGVLPRIADYGEAWELVRSLTAVETGVLGVVGVLNLLSYAPLWTAALPGLPLVRAVLTDQASTAVANTVPVGFAFGVGTSAAMFHSFGCSPAAISRAVVLTGVWNNLVKLGTPALALPALAVVGEVTGGLAVAAVLGGLVLVLVVGALLLALTSAGFARAAARAVQRAAAPLLTALGRPAPTGWASRADRFRRDSLGLVRDRWPRLTAAALASHAALFLLLLTCLRAVAENGDADVHWIAVLAVFAVTRLVTLVPITPGALGVAELSYVAGLTAIGVAPATAAGAVLVFRALTWFLTIPLGVLSWMVWRRWLARHGPVPVGG